MTPSKWQILYYFLSLRWSRIWSSGKTTSRRVRKWKDNLQLSEFYNKKGVENFPLMNKATFMKHFDEINTVGIKKEDAFAIAEQSELSRDFSPEINGISIGLSSGTSGNKGVFLTSKREQAIWVGAVLDRVIGFSLRKRTVAFFLRANNNLYEAVNSAILKFHFFDIKIALDEQLKKLILIEPDILVAQPSVLVQIAKYYQEIGIKPSFRKVISVAEVLEEDHKLFLQKIFRCRIDQVYQCTEGFLAYTCSKGKLHLNEDWLKIERKYIDKDQKRFHPVITDYLRSSQPVVRYCLNDILHEGAMCTCGLKSTVIDRIEGRADDVFVFTRNGNQIRIFPDFLRRVIITSSDQILNYVVTQRDNETITLHLDVHNKTEESNVYSLATAALHNLLSEMGVDDVRILKENYSHNPLSKFKRIRNESFKIL